MARKFSVELGVEERFTQKGHSEARRLAEQLVAVAAERALQQATS